MPRPTSRRPPSRLARLSAGSDQQAASPSSPVPLSSTEKEEGTKEQISSSFELGEEFNPHSSPTPTTTTRRKTPLLRSAFAAHGSQQRKSVFIRPPAEAFQTPIVGKDHCGVKLRELDTKSPFPEVMLIRARATRESGMSVRLISPTPSSPLTNGSYLLITRRRLIIFNHEQSTVSERTKVSQMAYEILAGKEMACTAARLEIANDDGATLAAFHRALGMCGRDEVETEEQKEGAEELDHSEDSVYWMANESGTLELLARGEPPNMRHFDPEKILVFDFLTEIYVWVGRDADKGLVKAAMERAKQLTNSHPSHLLSEVSHRLFSIKPSQVDSTVQTKRPSWVLLRKFTQGIVDCLFRHKFEDWEGVFPTAHQLQVQPQTPTPRRGQGSGARPWSVPAASHLCSTLLGVEEWLLKDDQETAEKLAAGFESSNFLKNNNNVLLLEGLELRHTDENVFTEHILHFKCVGEQLVELEHLDELEDSSCYVLQWNYRVEREGVRRLNGTPISSAHETGRQRTVFFYWLGRHSSIKDQSKCALALRDHDKARHEHVRVEQGQEPALFLSLFHGLMIVSSGCSTSSTSWHLVVGGTDLRLYTAEELHEPVEFRSQTCYIRVDSDSNKDEQGGGAVSLWRGEDCPEQVLQGGHQLAAQLAKVRGLSYDQSQPAKPLDGVLQLKPSNWIQTPRLIRIYGNDGHELTSARLCDGINFCFRQVDLRDCVLVDQGNHLWVWAENEAPVTTFALRVADAYWRNQNKGLETDKTDGSVHRDISSATVVSQGAEPEEFKALFPTWREHIHLSKEEEDPSPPRPLQDLLHERTKHRTIEELKERNLPNGCDTKHLERYLTEDDFGRAFGCTKAEYAAMPMWRQISMKKEANLF